ncbi:hypothetical protein ACFYKT_20570 [Cytobacillus sp. FJAT-53684]|uniref:Uncharacterized protein n=1 Tax=Cytobacillus mangrovibacter TaxID=3299024 RepID=A0ABW6K3B5_9BACI
MKLNFSYLAIILFSILLISGCSSNQDNVKTNVMDNYESVREVAWLFVEEKGWNYNEDDWKHAQVEKKIVNENYNLDGEYLGKEIFTVTIEDAVASPLILVDPNSKEVIGYIPGE